MKKKLKKVFKILMMGFVAVFASVLILLSVHGYLVSSRRVMKKNMNFDIDLCTPILDSETTEFAENNEKLYKYHCPSWKDEEVRQQLTKIGANSLPMTENINLFLYGADANNTKRPSAFSQMIIPKIANGYYYFIIRNKYTKLITNRNESNLFVVDDKSIMSMILYDRDSRYLYYIEFNS